MIETGDIFSISGAVLLAGTWAWVLRVKHPWPGWREKSALAGFLCATIAVISDLLLIVVMHFRGDSTLASALFEVSVVVGLLLGTAGIVLGFLGKGTPKAPALVWSSLVLLSVAITVVATIKAIE